MTDHHMYLTTGIRDLAPTPPDQSSDRWQRCESDGTLTGRCSCSLVISGPRQAVARSHLAG